MYADKSDQDEFGDLTLGGRSDIGNVSGSEKTAGNLFSKKCCQAAIGNLLQQRSVDLDVQTPEITSRDISTNRPLRPRTTWHLLAA